MNIWVDFNWQAALQDRPSGRSCSQISLNPTSHITSQRLLPPASSTTHSLNHSSTRCSLHLHRHPTCQYQLIPKSHLNDISVHLRLRDFLPLPSGEADEGHPPLPLPWLAGGRHPSWGQRHDRHHRLGAATAAAVGEPPHRRTLQVS